MAYVVAFVCTRTVSGHAKILELMGVGAILGCTKCMTVGETVARRRAYHDYRHLLEPGHLFLTDGSFGEPIENPVPPERKTKEMMAQLAQAQVLSGDDGKATGVKGASFPSFHGYHSPASLRPPKPCSPSPPPPKFLTLHH